MLLFDSPICPCGGNFAVNIEKTGPRGICPFSYVGRFGLRVEFAKTRGLKCKTFVASDFESLDDDLTAGRATDFRQKIRRPTPSVVLFFDTLNQLYSFEIIGVT